MRQSSTAQEEDQGASSKPSTRVHITTLRSGIQPSPEFAKKGLASNAVNVGMGFDCGQAVRGIRKGVHPPLKRSVDIARR
jgi:hypothetical protein